MTNETMKSDPAYLSLCELTDAIVAEWRAAGREWVSRPLAFDEACQRRPDLAADAIYPGGAWVNAEAHPNEPPPSKDKKQPKQSREDRIAEEWRKAEERRVGSKR
jgi:hypothetical protein